MAALQLFAAKQWWKLDVAVLVAFKGLVGWEPGPLHEAVPFLLFSGCKLCLKDMEQEFFLLRRCLILQRSATLLLRKSLRAASRTSSSSVAFIFGVIRGTSSQECLVIDGKRGAGGGWVSSPKPAIRSARTAASQDERCSP